MNTLTFPPSIVCTLNGQTITAEELNDFLGKDELLWSDWGRFMRQYSLKSAVLRRSPSFEHDKSTDTLVRVPGVGLLVQTRKCSDAGRTYVEFCFDDLPKVFTSTEVTP